MNVMLDLETLGFNSNAPILSIGAVEFDNYGLYRSFYVEIDLQSCLDAGLKPDASTILWWQGRDNFPRGQVNLAQALVDFRAWYPKGATIWSNGAAFDIPILASAYKAVGNTAPWEVWNTRCYRTAKALLGLPNLRNDHNALNDAKNQAIKLIGSLQ